MANFFRDNPDILFHFEHADFEPIVRLVEDDFHGDRNGYGPKDVPDAVDNYRRALDIVGQIAGDFIAPRAEAIDQEGNALADGRVTYSAPLRACLDVLGKADLMGFTLPRRFGGLNFPTLVYTMAIEMVSRADASIMNIFGLQGIAETINAFASEEIKAKYLPQFCAGTITGAMVLTEPDAGSDLQRVKLRAYLDDNGQWRLDGVKRFITNGCGEVLLVLARSEPDREGGLGLSLFVTERNPNVYVRRLENKLGIHGSPTCELRFDNCPAELVGERQRGLVTYVMALMNGARVGIAAQGLGIAQAAFNEARRYAHVRKQFGRSIEEFPAVADLLADMTVRIRSARAISYEAARWMDVDNNLARKIELGLWHPGDDEKAIKNASRTAKRLSGFLTPLAKYLASETAIQVTYDAIQVLGGSGYMRDYPLERLYRDARITTIYEGTSQLQVVAAIRGITSGIAEKRFAELSQPAFAGELADLEQVLAAARASLTQEVEFVKKADMNYQDLVARKMVDTAIDIYTGYLFLRQAEADATRLPLARRTIQQAEKRIAMNHALVLSGEASTLKDLDALLGPIPEN
jgi:alkylation response protein AidB-like acyl-CoA dehydrogenase